MQGGGSSGAYECGVYKTLAKRGIKFDIMAGTSIGARDKMKICVSMLLFLPLKSSRDHPTPFLSQNTFLKVKLQREF